MNSLLRSCLLDGRLRCSQHASNLLISNSNHFHSHNSKKKQPESLFSNHYHYLLLLSIKLSHSHSMTVYLLKHSLLFHFPLLYNHICYLQFICCNYHGIYSTYLQEINYIISSKNNLSLSLKNSTPISSSPFINILLYINNSTIYFL